jgi:cytochrome c556
MHNKLIISLLSLIPAFCLFSITCAGEVIPDPATKSSKAVLRSLHSEDIRRIMGRLHALAYEREYTELELDRIRLENLEALALAAADLVQIAGQLPQLLPDNQLSDEEQVTFKAMANQLHNETLQLLNTDSGNSYRDLKSGYRRLQQTCAACHNLFRDW